MSVKLSILAFHQPCLPLKRRRNVTTSISVHRHRYSSRTLPTCVQQRPKLGDVVNSDRLDELRVGGFAVPRHRWRYDLRQRGVHRSVEYFVERLCLDGRDVHSTRDAPASRRGDVIATVRPAVRLMPRLDREWPVSVSVGDGMLWSYKRDVAVCAVVCAAASTALVAAMLALGSVCGIYGIASESMVPTLLKGDALFVEKLSLRAAPPRRGEVVLFRPPREVALAVRRRANAPPLGRYLLVKRVVAIAGDRVDVDASGVHVNGAVVAGRVAPFLTPRLLAGVTRIEEGYVYVLGDNGDASVDSRFWGPLPERDVVGRPVARIFPVERFRLWALDERR